MPGVVEAAEALLGPRGGRFPPSIVGRRVRGRILLHFDGFRQLQVAGDVVHKRHREVAVEFKTLKLSIMEVLQTKN